MDMVAIEMVFLLPGTEAVDLGTRNLIEVHEGHTLCSCDIRGPLRLRLTDDAPVRTIGITGRERHQDGVGTCLTDILDVKAQIMAVAIDGIRNLLTLIETYDHRVGVYTVDHASRTFLIKKVCLIVMTNAHNHPVAWLQSLTDGWP